MLSDYETSLLVCMPVREQCLAQCASCAHRKVTVTLLLNHEFKGRVYANELVIEQQLRAASLVASKACLEMCVEQFARSVRNTKIA